MKRDWKWSVAKTLAVSLVYSVALPQVAQAEYDVRGRWQPAIEHSQEGSDAVTISTVSTRNDMVTGGDVLVRIEGDNLEGLEVALNDANVSDVFEMIDGALVGLVTGLVDGENTISVSGAIEASLVVTNHPITGPLFAGPQQDPFVCETEAFEGINLGEPLDEDCSIETRVDYFYHAGEDFFPLENPDSVPDDASITTLQNGDEVPYIVRVETGTINRSIYNIAMLHNPAEPEPSPFADEAGWNNKLVYYFGGGCIRGYYRQGGGDVEDVLEDGWLREGYAVAHSTLNVAGNNCNTMLSAETTVMIKEHFVETYGEPQFTIGTGSSGGSYQTQAIVNAYPGVLDGIIIGSVFADVTTTTLFTLADSRLLHHYFNETNDPNTYSPWQQRAISGFGSEGNIEFLGTTGGALRIHPTESFLDAVPQEDRYDPDTNPGGARSTVYDHTLNVYGTDDMGRAFRPLDNVGVQYGLAALNEGVIDKAMFLDLNENIGGFDLDLNYVPERHEADPSALEAAYYTGLIMDADADYASVPVIDFRNYRDDRRNGDIHHLVHGFSSRARLLASNPDSYNHVMWFGGQNNYSENGQLTEAFDVMDEWLTTIAETETQASAYETVRMTKPEGLQDACFTPIDGERLEQTQIYQGSNECSSLYYPAFASPRQVAGSPMANDIAKCALKPLDRSDYHVTFTAEEWGRLEEIFPQGVCDWTQPGIGQVPSANWVRYAE